jgi:O-antigen/teichoic acid export membrane protein
MDLKKAVVKNILTGWGERVVTIGASLLLTPILLAYLGKEPYGIWVAIGQGAGLLIMLDFGIASSITRFISKNLALEKHDENVRVFNTAMIIFFAASLLTLMVVLGLSPFVPSLFKIVDAYKAKAIWVFLITGLHVALIIPLRVGRGLLKAKYRYDLISVYNMVYVLLRLSLILILFALGADDLLSLALITFFVGLFVEIAVFVSGKRKHRELKFHISAATRRNFREMISLGGSAMVRTISGTLYRRSQIIAVGIILGVGAVPLFSIPSALLLRVGPFVNRLGATFTPLASYMYAKGNVSRLQELNMVGIRYGLMLSLPLCVFLILFAENILNIWLGKSGLSAEDLHRMCQVISIMAVPFALNAPQIASHTTLSATGKHWLAANSFFISSLSGLVVTVLLVRFTHLGILGAGIGVSLTYMLTGVFIWPVLICRHLGISLWKYFKKSYLAPVLVSIVLAGFSAAFNMVIRNSDIHALFVRVAMFFTAAFIMSVYLVLLPQHREYLLRSLKLHLGIPRRSQ